MKQFLVEYADSTPSMKAYVVKSGFRSYFNTVGGKAHYKSGDDIILYIKSGKYSSIAVNGAVYEWNVDTNTVDSIIKNRFVPV